VSANTEEALRRCERGQTLLRTMGDELRRLRRLGLEDEADAAVTRLRIDLACVVGELNAVAMAMEGERRELLRVRAGQERQLMLRGLHRAGDHTLDPEEEETLRPPGGDLGGTTNKTSMEAAR
jgi:hypothetical protein